MNQRYGRTSRVASLLVAGLAVVAVSTAAGQQSAPAAERTIRVSGVGEIQVTPDEARISLAVETMEETAQAAGAANAAIMDQVIAALVGAGIPRGDIETQHYAIHPDYVHDEGRREPRIRGYRAVNQVVVKTRDMERLGELIDLALAADANRVNGVSFAVTDPSRVMAEALTEAVERARRSAEAIAAALGVRLGEVLDASTTAAVAPPVEHRQRMDMAELAAAPPTAIEPGEQTVRATVSLVYAIDGG